MDPVLSVDEVCFLFLIIPLGYGHLRSPGIYSTYLPTL